MVRNSIDRVYILYEPIALLIFLALFIVINPLFHGLLGALLVIFSISHIRNYVNGKIIRTYRSIRLGRKLNIGHQDGIITDMGRFGLRIRSDEGLHYIPYNTLVGQGFILSSGENIGGYYKLNITLPEELDTKVSQKELTDMLISSPYIDGTYKPEIIRSTSTKRTTKVKLLVREESHVYDLMALLEENGYQSEITKT